MQIDGTKLQDYAMWQLKIYLELEYLSEIISTQVGLIIINITKNPTFYSYKS